MHTCIHSRKYSAHMATHTHKPNQTSCRGGPLALTVVQIRCHSKSVQEKTTFYLCLVFYICVCVCVNMFVYMCWCSGHSIKLQFAESSRNVFFILFGMDTKDPHTIKTQNAFYPLHLLVACAGPDSHHTAQMEKTQMLNLHPHTCYIDSNYKPIGPTSCWGSEVNLSGFHLTELPRSGRAKGREREAESNGQIEIERGRRKPGAIGRQR